MKRYKFKRKKFGAWFGLLLLLAVAYEYIQQYPFILIIIFAIVIAIILIKRVKLYSPQNRIGREKIQKLHSAMIDSRAEKAIFVTTSDFTSNAIEYAKKHGIEVVDSEELVSLINTAKKHIENN